ncbi:hypothetical protein SF12_19315, partial [Streptomyces sp. MBRL 601]
MRGQPGCGPVATGRAGSADQSDQEHVEGGVDSGHRQGQHLVGPGDAGAAVDADLPAGVRAQGGETAGEFGRGEQAAVLAGVLGGRGGVGARDVAADPVDRLDVAPVPLGGAGVQEHPGGGQCGGAVGVQQLQLARFRGEVARLRRDFTRLQRPVPGGEPAVEDAYLGVAGPAQQPPGAGRRQP